MLNKSAKRSSISFLGNATTDVTGSAYLIKHKQSQVLLDCGLVQGSDIYTDFMMNHEQARKFKPKEIDAVVIRPFLDITKSGNSPLYE